MCVHSWYKKTCDWLNHQCVCWSQRVKLIVPPARAQGGQKDQTSPWLVIAGDPGCPGIAHHFLARTEQSKVADTSGQLAPLIDVLFLVRPVTWTGHPRFPPDWKTIKLAQCTAQNKQITIAINLHIYSCGEFEFCLNIECLITSAVKWKVFCVEWSFDWMLSDLDQ